MNLPDPHRRLLSDVVTADLPHTLVLAGGYALQAHGLVDRPHANVDMATESQEPTDRLAEAVATALRSRARDVAPGSVTPLTAHLSVTDPPTGERCDLILHKETLWHPPVLTDLGPTLSLEDAVGTKIRALYDRGAAVDLIDARAAAARFTLPDLEDLGRRHAHDPFDLPTYRSRLEGSDWYPDAAFTAYGLTEADIAALRAWAQHWSDDIAERLLEDGANPDTEDGSEPDA
ncbi:MULTISPECIES: hypothetical protein [unclassified Streptomyces]|uniref:hypothetical protein n=1 Tax=unclassified Streptomyces TaxID=2593676 RepID=UPI001F0497A0|nr:MULTISPECIES: hypothetical protein [unclassified Streptomyces]MCH0563057.1 hypothetical protein [Streptomyces sp. MUM 2J]MCH0570313.1 hypothetical protein [Streptomyces sp. MUM 136J]